MERRRDPPHTEYRAQFCEPVASGETTRKIVCLDLLGPRHDAISPGAETLAQALPAAVRCALCSLVGLRSSCACAEQTPRSASLLAREAPAFFDGVLLLRHAFAGVRSFSLASRSAGMVRAAGFRSRCLLGRKSRHRRVRNEKVKKKRLKRREAVGILVPTASRGVSSKWF